MKLKFLFALMISIIAFSAFADQACRVSGQFYTNGATYSVGDNVFTLEKNNQFSPTKILAIECNGGHQFATKISIKKGTKTELVGPSAIYYLSGCDGKGEKQLCIGDKRTFYTFMPRSNMIDGEVIGKVIAYNAILVAVQLPDRTITVFTKDATFP